MATRPCVQADERLHRDPHRAALRLDSSPAVYHRRDDIVGDHDETVENEDWTPIGVVGLGRASRIESFAELSNRGFLAIVNEPGDHPAGTVVWADGRRFGGAVTVIAASTAKLVFERA